MTHRVEQLADGRILFYPGDCVEEMKGLDDNSVDACLTDPPYGLGKEPDAMEMLRAWLDGGHYDVPSKSGFMGKEWDAFVPQPAVWKEVIRVLKPGGHTLCFFGTRTYDLGVLAMRTAGFEVRDPPAAKGDRYTATSQTRTNDWPDRAQVVTE